MISHYLNALKEAKGMTHQQLSEKSGVSLSTVERILAGKAKDSSFKVLRDLTFALEGNLDDLSAAMDSTPGIHPETWGAGPILPKTPEGMREVATSADINHMADAFLTALKDKDAAHAAQARSRVAMYEEEIKRLNEHHKEEVRTLHQSYLREIRTKDRWIKWLFTITVILVVFLVAVLVYDILNPNIGWVRRMASWLVGDAI